MPTPTVPSATPQPVAFGASWSRATRLLTLVVLLCCVGILDITYSGARASFVFYLTAAFVAVAIILAYCYAPIGYRLDSGAIIVRRIIGDKTLPLSSLRAARLMEPAELAHSTWRWPSIGGLFGFYGTFETPALGRHQWYASRDEDLVLLQTADRPIVLSPDDTATFVREVNQRLRASARI